MKRFALRYKLSQKSTRIFIEQDMISSKKWTKFTSGNSVIITDHHVKALYGDLFKMPLISLPPGEGSKSRDMKAFIEDELFRLRLSRDTVIIALGGGVILDLVGFVAATFCRGVPLIFIPTTLLAMADVSIGAKTGINTSFGKNLIGAFYPPQAVFMDLKMLHSLPEKELLNGLAEILKHGLIKDANLIDFIVSHRIEWDMKNAHFFEEVLYRSCLIKKEIVEKDYEEKGLRRILNFGHTIGHALEHASDYFISHGEAIVLGMIAEMYLGTSLGFLSKEDFEKICRLFQQFPFSLKIPKKLTVESILKPMELDKKALLNKIRFVQIKTIGKVHEFNGEYCTKIELKKIQETLTWILEHF